MSSTEPILFEGPLRETVRTVVDRTGTGVITSDAFQQVWEGASRRSHARW
ncbi:hypothetical protein [Streptomyces sp. AK010]|nr:hypothetical protein [Streptomyces sp. AK010]MBB6421034.1 hypothetical protein [Streptomyces sp. AK010]